MTGQKPEIQKQKLENIGYISLVDFLTQNNIDVKDIRQVFDDTTKSEEGRDIVGNFLQDQRIIDLFNTDFDNLKNDPVLAEVGLEEYGYTSLEELKSKIISYHNKFPGKNLSDPQVQRQFINGYHQTHKELDILANKQHAGDRITSTISELVQNAIDATAQAKDPNVTPIGKFGMGAKTMFGSMGAGDYMLLQSKDKTFFVIKLGEGVESLVCSDKIEFIEAQLAKRGDSLPSRDENTGTIATLSYAKTDIDDSVANGIAKFRYNPNVNLELNESGEEYRMNELDKADIRTEGKVRINTKDYKDHKNISIYDEGNGFDPIKLFQTSTKNSESRYSKEFENDSKAFVNSNESNDVIMLIQGTQVSIDTIKDKDRYIESTLTSGIVIENGSYLQTSESRSDWSVTDYTNQSLEFAFTNLIEDAPSKQIQANTINTLYLWYESLPQAKKLSLTSIKDLLVTQAQDVKEGSKSQFLPNLREFNQFNDGNTIFLHPDLIGTYSPENIPNSQFQNSKNGFAVWGVDMKVIPKDNISMYEAIGSGQDVQSQSMSKVLKLDKSIPPQIWIDNQLHQKLESIYSKESSDDVITEYNYQVWLINSYLNEIDNSYKAVGQSYEYIDSYYVRQDKEESQRKLNELIAGNELIADLNNQYGIQDKEFLIKVDKILNTKVEKEDDNKNKIKLDYTSKEIKETGKFELDIDNDIMLSIDWNDKTFVILHKNSNKFVEGQLPYGIGAEEGGKFYNSFMGIKNGNASFDNDSIGTIIDEVFDGNADIAFDKFESMITAINEKESSKPSMVTLPLKYNMNSKYFDLEIPDNDYRIRVEEGNGQLLFRYKKRGHERTSIIDASSEDIQTLFDNPILQTKIRNELLSTFNRDIDQQTLDNLSSKLLHETMNNKEMNGDNGNYQAKFKGKGISLKGFEGSDIVFRIDEDNNIVLNYSNQENAIYVEDIILGNINDETDEDGYSGEKELELMNFSRFIGREGVVNIDQNNLEYIEKFYEELINGNSNYLDDMTTKHNLYITFKEIFSNRLKDSSSYTTETTTNTKKDHHFVLKNPTNEVSVRYDKEYNHMYLELRYYNTNKDRVVLYHDAMLEGSFEIGDKIKLANVENIITQAITSDNEYEGEICAQKIAEALIKQFATVTMEGAELETREVEGKKELLEQFAQVASQLEQLKSKINPTFNPQDMSQSFGKKVENLEEAKKWLEVNQELMNYIASNPNEFEDISQDLIKRINRMRQNNYYVDKTEELLNDNNKVSNHLEALQNSGHLTPTDKSGVLLSVLNSKKVPGYDIGKFNSIISGFSQLEQGLGQASAAALDNVKCKLLAGEKSEINRGDTIVNNLVNIKNKKPELYDYIITKLTGADEFSTTLINDFFYDEYSIKDKDKPLYRYLTTPDAVLLSINQLKPIEVDSKLTVNPTDFTLGELGFMGRQVVHADQLESDSISGIQKNSKAKEISSKINKEINRLATSQVSGDKWSTVLRELFQNSKDSANKMEGGSNIAFNQDIYNPEQGSWLGSQELLRTEFTDDATGIPEFLFNYFNPMKSTKDIEDAISAGAFGCGAITINSIAEFYEIKTKNKDEQDGFHIKVAVQKSQDGTQVIGTKVVELSRIKESESGTQIRMYSKNGDKSTIPELQALISQGALIELSELEVLNNPNVNLTIQGEKRESDPKAKSIYKSDKVQFVQGVKPGYWVKNLFVSDLNHDQNQFSKPLPEFLSKMLKDNPVAINFQNKLELVRTRTGFSEDGEKEALNILTHEYLKYTATQLFNGSMVKIPNLDADLSAAYRKFTSVHNDELSDQLFNKEGMSLDELQVLTDSEWIAMLLNAPIEVGGQSTSLKNMFQILEEVALEAKSKDITSQDKIEEAVNEITMKMPPAKKALYDKLQNSKLTSVYGSLNVQSAINLSISTAEMEKTEKILKPEELPQESEKIRKIFESVFIKLTADLPISRFDKSNTDHRMVYVTREVGNDHSGQIKRDEQKPYMLWKFDYKKIGLMSRKTNLDSNDYAYIFEVIVHEIAHQLEQVGQRKPGTHDEIFNELMKCNFNNLINQIQA